MFDITKIAQKIRAARTAKNMTQMDLADAMGISYQAVSNWERGNSMPDIAKLPELCRILELNLDELLDEDSASKTVEKIIHSDEEVSISLEELADVAPILPPKQMERVLDENRGNVTSIDIDALIELAPFLDDAYLNELAEKISLHDMEQLIGLAPFINRDVLGKIALKHAAGCEGTSDALIGLAPFLKKETLAQLVEYYLTLEDFDISGLAGLCPFLGKATVRRIADFIMSNKDYDALSQIAPFM